MTITLDPRRHPVTRPSNGTVDHTRGAWTLRVSTEHEEDALLPFPENDFMLEVLTAERTNGGWIVRGWTDSDEDRPVGEPEFALALPGTDRDWRDACEAVVDALGMTIPIGGIEFEDGTQVYVVTHIAWVPSARFHEPKWAYGRPANFDWSDDYLKW